MKNKLRIDNNAKKTKTIPTETVTQAKIVKLLKSLGWIVVRNRGVDIAGWPDLTAYRNGVTRFIEVKRTPEDKPSPIQEHVHEQLREQGFKVYVWDYTHLKTKTI